MFWFYASSVAVVVVSILIVVWPRKPVKRRVGRFPGSLSD